jgi:pimeloyl-ACP methyl ester carboxylesterase
MEGHGQAESPGRFSRRRLLGYGALTLGALAGAGAGAFELIDHGVLPGQQTLDQLDGGCSVPSPRLTLAGNTTAYSGRFYSAARRRQVGFTLAYPRGHAALPLVVMLHGYGGNHTNALAGMSPAQAVALEVDGQPLAPMALVTVDGGGGYWNPHPDDDPMGMVIDELIPMCQSIGLGRAPHTIGTMGISMGGYGALLLAEKYPSLIRACAAISPAVWTTYGQARGANAGAFASATAFDDNNVITHANALDGRHVRVASGNDDPFHPGVEVLAQALPAGATIDFSNGCHTGPFFVAQEPPSLAFLSHALR